MRARLELKELFENFCIAAGQTDGSSRPLGLWRGLGSKITRPFYL
jgi:hypothetical protein